MSVKRFYWDTPSEYGHAEEHPEGELVWWKDYAKLEAENARLKAEVERLTQEASKLVDYQNSQCEPNTRGYYLKLLNQSYEQSNEYYRLFVVERSKAGMAEDEIKNLKAEVERLTEVIRREVDGGVDLREEAQRTVEENHNLRAEVERLRKAGDAMAKRTEFFQKRWDADELCQEVEDWNAAKEGKPSEQKSPSFIEDLGNGVEKHDLLFRYPAKEGKQP